MKRKVYLLLIGVLLFSLPFQAVFAAERVVRMTVSGCAS